MRFNIVCSSLSKCIHIVFDGTDGFVVSGCVVGGCVVGGCVVGGFVTGGCVTGGFVAGGCVTGGFVAGGCVTGGFVAGGCVTGGFVAGGCVTGGFVAGGCVDGFIAVVTALVCDCVIAVVLESLYTVPCVSSAAAIVAVSSLKVSSSVVEGKPSPPRVDGCVIGLA